MSEIIINEERRIRERRTTPIYVKIELPPTEEDIERLKNEFQKSLMAALEAGYKIPYTDTGSEFVQKLFQEAYERILPKYISITVIVEK
jgi:hypothetical protein